MITRPVVTCYLLPITYFGRFIELADYGDFLRNRPVQVQIMCTVFPQ